MSTKTRNRFVIEDDNGLEIQLPCKRIVCPRCDGGGVHDNPAFSNGFTQEDFAEDPDFAEEYFRGRYDVTCEECGGDNVITVPDEERMTKEQLALWHEHCASEADYRATCAAERRMGA